MNLSQFIVQQIEALKLGTIDSAEFSVSLDGEGQVVDNSMTTIRFKIEIS